MNNGGPGAGNYLLSSGTTVWDASAQPAYHNQVIGIVRDDASGLTQKQSHTQDDSLRVFVGSLSADNASNAGAITSNLSSIIIGNNGGKAQAEWGRCEARWHYFNLRQIMENYQYQFCRYLFY